MPLTPNSSLTPYLTAVQFLERYDPRTVGDFLSDTGQRITPPDLLTDSKLSDLMKEASGWLEAACLRGNRYLPTDLVVLVGNGSQLLIGIVAGVTMYLVWDRRPGKFADHKLPLRAEMAMQMLEQLSQGERIFPFIEAENAGLIHHYVESAFDVEQRNGIAVQASRYFGRRSNRIPPSPGGSWWWGGCW